MSLPDSYDRWRTHCEPAREYIEASYDVSIHARV